MSLPQSRNELLITKVLKKLTHSQMTEVKCQKTHETV